MNRYFLTVSTHLICRLLLLSLVVSVGVAHGQIISTIVGNGTAISTGDGGLAVNARVHSPIRVKVDAIGNIYIADSQGRIRKIALTGIISTVAGNGQLSDGAGGGDGGQAILSRLGAPQGVAIDAAGNIFISEYAEMRIRKVTPSGTITTVAGIFRSIGSSGDGGPATSAQLNFPNSVTVDAAGSLYIAEGSGNRIRKVSPNGIISTIAGTGVRGYGGDGGPATSALLSGPDDVALDAAGNLYITDRNNSRIRKVDTSGIITSVAGGSLDLNLGDGGQATVARLNNPSGVAVDATGNIFISDTLNNRIRKVDTRGVITTIAGTGASGSTGDGGLAVNATLVDPYGVTVDARGDVYIADGGASRVRKVTFSTPLPPLPPISRRGGIDLDGLGKSAAVVRATSGNQLSAGRLVNNVFQWTNLPDPGSEYRLIAPVDIAGNGKSDLPMLRETPLNSSGQGSAQYWPDFSGAAPVLLREVKPAWDVQAVGDLDGDGFGDLVWRFRGQSPNIDDQGVSYIWFSNGAGLSQVRKRGGAPLTWTLLGAADINGDGASDMIYVSPLNRMRALLATPNRTCANLTSGDIATGFTALKLADFTGFGRADVLIRNAATGEVRLIGLNATGLTLPPYTGTPDDPNASCTSSSLEVTQSNYNIGTTDPTWTLYVTGDFNGDGIFDIVWKRPDNTLTLWLMSANGAAPTIINNAGTAPANTSVLPLQ
jgi:sugar lactone lactonase YvrE